MEVDDIRQQLRSIALDVLANDPEVKRALDARLNFHLAELEEAEQAGIRELAQAYTPLTTPRLGEQLVEDSEAATSAIEDPETKKDAAFQFGSRAIRLWDVAKAEHEYLNKFVGTIEKIVGWFS